MNKLVTLTVFQKNTLDEPDTTFGSQEFDELVAEYEEYKRGGNTDVEYPQQIIGASKITFLLT